MIVNSDSMEDGIQGYACLVVPYSVQIKMSKLFFCKCFQQLNKHKCAKHLPSSAIVMYTFRQFPSLPLVHQSTSLLNCGASSERQSSDDTTEMSELLAFCQVPRTILLHTEECLGAQGSVLEVAAVTSPRLSGGQIAFMAVLRKESPTEYQKPNLESRKYPILTILSMRTVLHRYDERTWIPHQPLV